jgi:hypothetical protein
MTVPPVQTVQKSLRSLWTEASDLVLQSALEIFHSEARFID